MRGSFYDSFMSLSEYSPKPIQNEAKSSPSLNDEHKNLRFLAQTAAELADFNLNENIYDYCSNALKTLSGASYVVVNSIHREDDMIRTEAFANFADLSPEVQPLVGNEIVGAVYPFDHSILELESGKIEHFKGGIHELSFGKIPHKPAAQLEHLLEIDKIYGVGFLLNNEIYANAALIYTRERDITNKLAIEIFVQQASIAMKRLRTEYSLRESDLRVQQKEILMNITEELTGVGGWEKDLIDGVFHLTPGCQQVHGLEKEIVSIEDLDKTVHPDDLEKVKRAFREAVEGNGYYNIEHRIIRASDRSERIIKTHGIVIRDENGRAIKMAGAIQDITEEAQLIREKEERREYLETILTAVPDAVVTLDKNHHVIEWNPGAENLFHYTAQEAVGKHVDSLVAFNGSEIMQEAQAYSDSVTSGTPFYLQETVRYTKEGAPIDVLMSAAPIHIEGKLVGAVGVYADISKLKTAEQRVIKLLEEKDQLIKEVHHRIKNHMNTMYSILSVQASYFRNPDVLAAFEEAKNRIRLMQSLYHKLYSGSNSNSMQLQPFILELIRDLQTAYSTSAYISISTEIENIQVTAKQSLPIGIIVTELITNSLKYAFPDSHTGHISVSLKKTESKILEIRIEDDGDGASDSIITDKTYGFGLTLVQGYARQFDGSVDIESTHGTSIIVTLELEPV